MASREELERFRVRAPLRCDGVGRLDCAEDVESGARMAIRWLPLDANGAAAARALELLPPHPTLPRIRSTGLKGSAAFVAMDFPDGRLLSTLHGEPLDAETLVGIGTEIADALATIHLQKVFHGELSTHSVLLLPERRAVLWDMPLVIANRLTDRRGLERASATALRVAAFLSPERARGMPPSGPGDVFALGVLLCLAGGSSAPPGVTTLAVLHQIATGHWSPEIPRSFPEGLRNLVARMLDVDPLARPTAAEVAEALANPFQVIPLANDDDVKLEDEQLDFRSKTPYVVVGLAALGLAALAVVFGMSRTPASVPEALVDMVSAAPPPLAQPGLGPTQPVPADGEEGAFVDNYLSPLVLEPSPVQVRALPAVRDGAPAVAPAPFRPESSRAPLSDASPEATVGTAPEAEDPLQELKRPEF